ncbi:MAG: phosphonate C-P lyase system protein PhnG [Rhodospirillaceae bacterium]|nr:phosphonate C-P lyase system protein PhnG [Rhodospirillaceae bacterium]
MPLDQNRSRRRWMGLLAKASSAEIDMIWSRLPSLPAYSLLRRPETGLMMVQGRIGGDGQAFNLGEMTVTRCSVRLDGGTIGHAWIAGRTLRQAERSAVLDALLQDRGLDVAMAGMLDLLERAQAERKGENSRKVAATKVEFFTMVRGEN